MTLERGFFGRKKEYEDVKRDSQGFRIKDEQLENYDIERDGTGRRINPRKGKKREIKRDALGRRIKEDDDI